MDILAYRSNLRITRLAEPFIHQRQRMNWPGVPLVATLLLSFMQATAAPCPLLDGVLVGGDDKKQARSLQPWEFLPDPGDDKIRSHAIRLVREINSAIQQRSAALDLLTPQRGQSDDNNRPSSPNDLTSSQILSHVNQGAIWASILLSVDPSLLADQLRDFRKDLEEHLQDYSKIDPETLQRLAQEVKLHKASNKTAAEQATDAEISYQALIPKLRTLFPDYARMFQYQSPRLLNRPGEPTMFALFDPRITTFQPFKSGELMVSVSVVKVIQIDNARFRIEVYDADREIWDWEGYVARNPTKGAAGVPAFSVHNSTPFELNPNEAYVSESPSEVLTLDFAKGFPVITGTGSPIVSENGALEKIELQPGGFDPALLTSGCASVEPAMESASTKPALSKPVAETLASALDATHTPVSTPTPPASVEVPTAKIEAFFEMDADMARHGATPTSEEQAKVVQDVVDDWLNPYFLNATGAEADTLRKALPNLNGSLRMHFLVSPAPENPKDPPTVVRACTYEFPFPKDRITCTERGLSVALPREHFELPGEVLLDLVGVLIGYLPSQDKQNSEAFKKSLAKFLSNIDTNINPTHPVHSVILANLGVEVPSSGKFITADIPEHPTGALGIYNPEQQGMAYRIADFFNLLLKNENYLRNTGHTEEFEATHALISALPTGLVVHFTIHKEDDPTISVKRKEQRSPERSPTGIHVSMPEHAYMPTKDDFQILRDAFAEAIAKSESPGGLTGAEISSLLDHFLLLYATDPYNRHNVIVELIKSFCTTPSPGLP